MKKNKIKLIEPICLILLSATVLLLMNMDGTGFLLSIFVSLFLLFGIGLSILQFSDLDNLVFKALIAIALGVAILVCLSTAMAYLRNWQVTNALLALIWISLSFSLFRLSILYKRLDKTES